MVDSISLFRGFDRYSSILPLPRSNLGGEVSRIHNYYSKPINSLLLLLLLLLLSRSCVCFFGNRSGGPRTGHRARPQVADRGALYRGLLLNTDTKLNMQSRTMFQGWFRRNIPQAKVLTTVPRAAWHQGVVSHTVSPGNQATS